MTDSDADDLAALLARGRQQQDLELRLDAPAPDSSSLTAYSQPRPQKQSGKASRKTDRVDHSPPGREASPATGQPGQTNTGPAQFQARGLEPHKTSDARKKLSKKNGPTAKQTVVLSQPPATIKRPVPVPQVRRFASLPAPRIAQPSQPQGEVHPLSSSSPQGFSVDQSCPQNEEDERREQALAYLESIPLLFLGQLTQSVQVATARKHAVLTKNKKKAKTSTGDSQIQQASSVEGQSSKKRAHGESNECAINKSLQKGTMGIEMTLRNRGTGGEQVISVPEEPGSEPYGAAMLKFECVMRIASLLYEAILTNTTMTKRDIYYKDVGLFKTQAVVDKLVDDMVATAGLKRRDFHVCAAAKGLLISASLQVTLINGECLAISATNACLIPPGEKVDKLHRPVDWVLIVEKEAIFQTCCGMNLLADPRLGSGVIITGKGYPDLATLQMLHLISETYPNATFHCLVDADPHGLDILSVYRYGSRSSRYSAEHAGLALGDRVHWLGVKTSDWFAAGVCHDDLLELTERDVQKAMAMLRSDLPAEWKTELCRMLHLNRKAEIQIILTLPRTDTGLSLLVDAEGDAAWGAEGGTAAFKEYLVARMA